MTFRIEVTVRNGFPVVVTGEVCPADPEVGLTRSYLDDLDFMTPKGGSISFLRLTDAEIERLKEDVWYKLGY